MKGPLAQLPPEVQEAVFRLLDRLPELVDKLPPPAVKFLTEQAKLPFLVNRSLKSAEVVAQPVAEDVQPVLAVPVTPVYIKGSRGLTVGQALGTQQFWLLWSMIITCATAGLNTAAVYKQFAATSAALTGDEFQALVGGIGAYSGAQCLTRSASRRPSLSCRSYRRARCSPTRWPHRARLVVRTI